MHGLFHAFAILSPFSYFLPYPFQFNFNNSSFMPLHFPYTFLLSSQFLPYFFSYNMDDLLLQTSALLSPFYCIFLFSPLSLPIQLRWSIVSCIHYILSIIFLLLCFSRNKANIPHRLDFSVYNYLWIICSLSVSWSSKLNRSLSFV